jgi:hypothetical protein
MAYENFKQQWYAASSRSALRSQQQQQPTGQPHDLHDTKPTQHYHYHSSSKASNRGAAAGFSENGGPRSGNFEQLSHSGTSTTAHASLAWQQQHDDQRLTRLQLERNWMDKVKEAGKLVQETRRQVQLGHKEWAALCAEHGESVACGMQLLAKKRLQEAQEVQQMVMTAFRPPWLQSSPFVSCRD